jgi:hypothetical protein
MADELTVSISLRYVHDNVSVTRNTGRIKIDVAGDQPVDHVQEIGTSEEAITLNEAGKGGYCLLENLDATNFIEIRPDTGVADLIKLLPGDVALFRITGDAAPYAAANTAACNMRVTVFPL